MDPQQIDFPMINDHSHDPRDESGRNPNFTPTFIAAAEVVTATER
jgi:hypothetical protein